MDRFTEKISVSEFKLDGIPSGKKKRLELLVDILSDGQPLSFSTLVVRGKKPEKTAY